jgi:3-hydroxymyristoyl/3-hydroxydecanoyl-(acyl carrier protein) dehydratase
MPNKPIQIDVNHPCFAGHFPDFAILPGVLVLERVLTHAAQALGATLGQNYQLLNIKFLAPVLPGNHLTINWVSNSESDHRFSVDVSDGDGAPNQVACTGQLRLKS